MVTTVVVRVVLTVSSVKVSFPRTDGGSAPSARGASSDSAMARRNVAGERFIRRGLGDWVSPHLHRPVSPKGDLA